MRIISGILKGKSLNFLRNPNTRPLKDSVRENIFNILMHSKLVKTKVENSNILDLYSGVGSFGIESLSRNAKKVTFIEKDYNASRILKDNLTKLSLINKSIIFTDEIENILLKIKEKFNIFFLDPPFKNLNFVQNLELIKKKELYEKNNVVVIHRERKTDENLENLIKIYEIKYYGRSKVIFGEFN